jgi:hypothetical protein
MYASEARRQVAAAPPPRAESRYPDRFYNSEKLPIQAKKPTQHYPITKNGDWVDKSEKKPGAVRAFYDENNRNIFDLGYHDPQKPVTKKGHEQFSLATYHPWKKH